jgi:hypothetical protein
MYHEQLNINIKQDAYKKRNCPMVTVRHRMQLPVAGYQLPVTSLLAADAAAKVKKVSLL